MCFIRGLSVLYEGLSVHLGVHVSVYLLHSSTCVFGLQVCVVFWLSGLPWGREGGTLTLLAETHPGLCVGLIFMGLLQHNLPDPTPLSPTTPL